MIISTASMVASGVAGVIGAIGGGIFMGTVAVESRDSQTLKIAKIAGGIFIGASALAAFTLGVLTIISAKGLVLGITTIALATIKATML